MSTKPQSSGLNPTSAAPIKQARPRKTANTDQTTTERVLLGKDSAKKTSTPTPSTAPKPVSAQDKDAPPKRKPRKLNQEPTSTPTAPTPSIPNEAAIELEALKSRVRGLEAKVEDLYKSGTVPTANAPRPPRRRGKGRKNSSATTTATLGNLSQAKQEQTAQVQELDDEEEADEELVRLESELEVARQDLAHYRPRTRRTTTEDTEYVEEIPRHESGAEQPSDRQVTLSGSYRIPLPATLNPEDVKTIQSGVSAAQNVARSFLDQRRALRAQSTSTQNERASTPSAAPKANSKPKAAPSPSMELSTDAGGGKQSWGEWIGGYSVAISRAVKTIEHEAAMEAQKPSQARPASSGTSAGKASGGKKKRPAAKTTLSGEQIQGLMS